MVEQETIHAEQYLAPETLAQLSSFELRSKMVVEGVMSGMHRSPYHGMAVEFSQHRQYVQGDDIRHLDWKAYGRSDKLYIKQYRQETNLDVVLLVDTSGSMSYGSLQVKEGWGGTRASAKESRWTKYDHAAAVSAALVHLCLGQEDRVGMALFSDEILKMVARSNTRGHWHKVIRALNQEPVASTTNLQKMTEQVLGKVTNRVLFILISDFFDSIDSLRNALARFRHRGHEVLLLNTLDRQEMQFNLSAAAPYLGLEGEGQLRLDPYSIRSGYLEAISEHMHDVMQVSRGFGYEYYRLDTHEPLGPALSWLMARRYEQTRRRGT